MLSQYTSLIIFRKEISMTSRRDFLKDTGLTASLLAGTTQYVLGEVQESGEHITVERPACQIPVIHEVDVVIVGGGCTAVAAAVSAKKNQARVFVMSEEPYLGEDLCGSMRYSEAWSEKPSKFIQPLMEKYPMPTPIQIKTFLDDQLIENKIPFLLTSHPSRVLLDEKNRVMGLVIVNRSGEQVVKCKSIIDASVDGSALRLSKLFKQKRSEPSFVEFTIMGNDKRKKENLVRETKIIFNKKEYLYSTYRFDGLQVFDKASQAKIENQLREKTWHPGMVDAADRCFYFPSHKISVKGQSGLESTMCEDHSDIYCLNGFGIKNQNDLTAYLAPNAMMSLGMRLGEKVGPLSAKRKSRQLLSKKSVEKSEIQLSKLNITRGQMESLSCPSESLPVLETVDVVVIGGGTAGAAAGVGAAESGANTLVIEPLHGLGGIGTIGMISVYYHGYEGGFNKRVDLGVKEIGGDDPRGKKIQYRKKWINSWKMEWYRREIEKFGGRIWFGTTACGALVKGKELQGVVVGTSFGKGIVMAKKVIDATGSSDIAIAAGAEYTYTNQEHAAIQGSGVPGLSLKNEYYNTDWTFITEFDAFDTTRALTLAKKQLKDVNFDNGKMVQTRERRRIVGEYTIQAMDVIHNRTYQDAISYHRSNFDTHGYTVDPFFQLKPPHKKSLEASVPLRSLLPMGYKNITVIGLGFSAHRDTMPVLRMQRCLQNQGHAVGYLSAQCIKQNKDYRDADLTPVQSYLKKLGTLPARLLCAESQPVSDSALDAAVAKLDMSLSSLETLLLDPERSFSKLKKVIEVSKKESQREAASFILGMYGHKEGQSELMKLVSKQKTWDKGWNYRGMGQFGTSSSPLDNLIIAMGRAGDEEILPVLKPLVNQLHKDSEFSHYRAIAIACESVRSSKASALLSNLLNNLGRSHVTKTMEEAQSKMIKGRTDNLTRNNSLRELVVARALYRCGDKDGLAEKRLTEYAKDLRGHFALHAKSVLEHHQT